MALVWPLQLHRASTEDSSLYSGLHREFYTVRRGEGVGDKNDMEKIKERRVIIVRYIKYGERKILLGESSKREIKMGKLEGTAKYFVPRKRECC